MKPVFALDTSGKTASVCIRLGQNTLFDTTIDEGLTHSETLLPLVQKAFAATGLLPSQVGLWAATIGPGSFTGLRIGLSMLKGLALPFNKVPAVGVSTLEALAAACGLDGTVVTALDARRGELYWAAFEIAGTNVQRLVADTAGPAGDIAKNIDLNAKSVFFVGDGAEICYNTFTSYGGVVRSGNLAAVSVACGAAAVAVQLQVQQQAVPSSLLQPQYLRLSQAERQRALGLANI